ncbi:MAG: hypothetical protein VX440_00530 [Pseudomonadota bacterium]|nr:hypothetical protein [Pseudomonadota bacterium]
MNRVLLFLTIFSFGYVFNDILKEYNLNIIDKVKADVAGMDYRELRRDRDFKRAVRHVISGNCYVDGSYVYC